MQAVASPTFEARYTKSILLPSESTFLSNKNLTTLPLSVMEFHYCCLKRFHHKDLFRKNGKRSVHDHDILFVLLPRKGTKRNIDYLYDKETVIMNTATNMGPLQIAALTYFLCAVISLGIAVIISILCRILEAGRSETATKTDSSK